MTTPTSTELEQKRAWLRGLIPQGRSEASTQGMNHVTIFAKDLEVTAEFYHSVIGMPVIGVTANRDQAEPTHMNVDMGNGMSFDFPNVSRLQRKAPEGVGGIMHIALVIDQDRRAEIKKRLRQRRVNLQEIGGGLYLKDPNGLGIELMAQE